MTTPEQALAAQAEQRSSAATFDCNACGIPLNQASPQCTTDDHLTTAADLVARLHREVNTWSMPGSGQELPPIAKLLQEAADMIERLQKDATRYQWLKATPLTLTPKYMKDFSTVDEAIDAAIAGKLPNHA